MKAIVFEINKNEMIVMDSKGRFQKMKFDGVSQVGNEIELNNVRSFNLSYLKQITSIAAIFLLVFGTGYGVTGYYSPYAYVDIDINPSVELVLNKYMRVLDVKKLNVDAEKIIPDAKSFRNKDIEQAVEMVLDNAESKNIFKDDRENAIMYTISGVNEKQLPKINNSLKNITNKKLRKFIKEENIYTETASVDKHSEAKKLKTSPGKLILYEKLKSVNPEASIDDVKKMTVRDTAKLIKSYKHINKPNKNNETKINDKSGTKKIKPKTEKEKNKRNDKGSDKTIDPFKEQRKLIDDQKKPERGERIIKNRNNGNLDDDTKDQERITTDSDMDTIKKKNENLNKEVKLKKLEVKRSIKN